MERAILSPSADYLGLKDRAWFAQNFEYPLTDYLGCISFEATALKQLFNQKYIEQLIFAKIKIPDQKRKTTLCLSGIDHYKNLQDDDVLHTFLVGNYFDFPKGEEVIDFQLFPVDSDIDRLGKNIAEEKRNIKDVQRVNYFQELSIENDIKLLEIPEKKFELLKTNAKGFKGKVMSYWKNGAKKMEAIFFASIKFPVSTIKQLTEIPNCEHVGFVPIFTKIYHSEKEPRKPREISLLLVETLVAIPLDRNHKIIAPPRDTQFRFSRTP